MNFALDLLDAVNEESPEAVLQIVQTCAERGEHLVISRWVSQQMNDVEKDVEKNGSNLSLALGADNAPFVNAMLAMASYADGKKNDPAALAFGQWAQAAFSHQPERFSELLSWCVHSTRPPLDSAGRELLRLGANPLDPSNPDEHEKTKALSGVKLSLTERRVTLVAHALSHQHPLAGDLVAQSSTSKEPWPVVAEVGVDGGAGGVIFPVNAAAYAVALGDVKMLREVCQSIRGDEHQMGIGLADAVDFALSSGLTKDCTPEMAHCVAVCIASGADLDHAKIGSRLVTQRVTLAQEVSDFAYRENKEQGQTDPSYSIASLFMSARTGDQSLLAISRLVNGYELDINGPVTRTGSRASLLHYAAACGHAGLVEGLVKLGADAEARDTKGLTPALWAQVFDRQDALVALDPSRSKMISPDSMEDASNSPWNDDNESWQERSRAEENVNEDFEREPSMTLEEFSALHGDNDEKIAPAAPASLDSQSSSSKPPENPVDRNSIAPSVTSAQASKGAALFSRLKSSQDNLAAKALAKDDAQEVINKADQKSRLASSTLSTLSTSPMSPTSPASPASPASTIARVAFRGR